MQIIPPQRKNRSQGFTAAFPLICPIPAHTIQQPHKPAMHRLLRAGGHTVKRCVSTDTRYHRHAGHCTGQRSRPIIIRYIRVQHTANHASPAGSAPTVCGSLASAAPGAPAEGSASSPVQGQPGGVSMLLTPGGLQSGTESFFHPPPGGGSPAAGAWRAARNP